MRCNGTMHHLNLDDRLLPGMVFIYDYEYVRSVRD